MEYDKDDPRVVNDQVPKRRVDPPADYEGDAAQAVVDKLKGLGNPRNEDAQAYKQSIAGFTIRLYDLNGTRCVLNAAYALDYIAKGFTVTHKRKHKAAEEDEPEADAPDELEAARTANAAAFQAAVQNHPTEVTREGTRSGGSRPPRGDAGSQEPAPTT